MRVFDRYHILAICGLHTVIPAGKGSLDIADFLRRVTDNVALVGLGDQVSSEHIGNSLPSSWPQAASHCDVDGRHRGVTGRKRWWKRGDSVEQRGAARGCSFKQASQEPLDHPDFVVVAEALLGGRRCPSRLGGVE